MKKRSSFWFLALIAAVVLIVYANSLSGAFVWDDENLILKDPFIKGFSHLRDFFLIPFGYSTTGGRVLVPTYRPLQSVTFTFDYFLWGTQPFGYHLTNIFFHALVGMLVYLLAVELTGQVFFSLFASLVYVVHPVNVAGVAYISGRAEPLSAVFLLVSLLLYIKARKKKKVLAWACYFFSCISYVGGFLSKEMVLALPALLVLYDLCFERRIRIKRLLPYVIICSLYVVSRLTILRFTVFSGVKEMLPLATRLMVAPYLVLRYLRLLFFPFDLHLGYMLIKPDTFWNPLYCGSALLTALFLWVTLVVNRRSALALFGFSWFFITLFLFLNILFQLNAPLAEHWLYVPAMGFIIGSFAMVRERILVSKKVLTGGAIGLVIFFSLITIRTNAVWKDNETVFRNIIKYSPGNFAARTNLGVVLKRQGRYEDAIEQFRIVLSIRPADQKAKEELAETISRLKAKYR